MSPRQESYAEKINKLLAKAESTTPQEAELLLAKAAELMAKWAIDDAMLEAARGVTVDEIVQHRFEYGGYYAADHGNLAWTVIRSNGLRGVYMKSQQWTSARTINGKSYRMWYQLEATGFQSDMDRAIMLDTSLQLQMMTALNVWWKEEDRSWMSKTQNVRARQSFMEGFASGVGAKLREATAAGRAAAEREQPGTEQQQKDSVALVLRSRKDQVDDWMDKHYGKLRAGRSSYRKTDYSASSAGSTAGRSADVGQPRMGSRKGLNR